MVVEAVRLAEVPVMVTVELPGVAELLATSVSTLDAEVGLVPNDAVTPDGRPEAARVTLPLNPPKSVAVIVSAALPPWLTDKTGAEDESVKPVCVTVNACVLLHELELV
jgi:hypothetical protein